MRIIKPFVLFLTLIVLLFGLSCKKEVPTNPQIELKPGFFVVNEGNYNWGNASLDYYEFESKQLHSDIFNQYNGRPLGDVFQSMIVFQGKAYLVVNNSGKIEVCDAQKMQSTAVVSGLNSPRYILPVSAGKAYVSDLYDQSVSVLDLSSLAVSKKIQIPYWTEEMLLKNGEVFVCAMKSNQIFVVDALSDTVIDSIAVQYSPSSIVELANGNLMVLCEGRSAAPQIPSALVEFNPGSRTVVREFLMNKPGAIRLRTNPGKDKVYWISQKDVYALHIQDNVLPGSPLISGQSRNFYGLNIRPDSGDIYVLDAKDYVQRGDLLIYDKDGQLKETLKVGIIPGAVYF